MCKTKKLNNLLKIPRALMIPMKKYKIKKFKQLKENTESIDDSHQSASKVVCDVQHGALLSRVYDA